MTDRPRIGTNADTPHSLRMKAAEFRRLAALAREEKTVADLHLLAEDYEEHARGMENKNAEFDA